MGAIDDVAAAVEDGLTEPERQVWEAAGTGRLVDLRAHQAGLDEPAKGGSWDANRTVRAELLVDLLTSVRVPATGMLRAVKLRGARITGRFDLEAATVGCPLLLRDCHFDQPINLDQARAPAIRLPGCHLPGLSAKQLDLDGDLELSDGFTVEGEVRLLGAHIRGSLELDGAHLTNPDGRALYADGLTVDQGLTCLDGFTADGQVRMPGARIGWTLELDGARLTNPGGLALALYGLKVDLDVFCRGGFTVEGETSLLGAHIGGSLDFSGASLVNHSGIALTADGLTVGSGMVCGSGFAAAGEVRLLGARIGGQLDLDDARLTNPSGTALHADRLKVDGSIFCRDGFAAEGEIRLIGARIGGSLEFDGARLANPDGIALGVDGLTVNRSMSCRDGFSADGEVRLLGAHIGGQLSFRGARLVNEDGIALGADQLKVNDMYCGDGFTTIGEFRMVNAHITGQLNLEGAQLTDPNGLALDLEGAQVTTLFLQPVNQPEGIVSLTNAKVGSFVDDPATWPEALSLGGFTYETLENRQVGVRARLRWLQRHPGGYLPQIYDQLAAAYRRAGHDEAARQVLVTKQWRRRRTLSPTGRLWNWLLYLTVGYGYRTWLAGLWLVGLLAVGTWRFDRAYPTQLVVAKQPTPAFHPVAYTLDVLLPVVDLGQQAAWIPQGGALGWLWVLTGAGWVLTTAVVAGLTGLFKRE